MSLQKRLERLERRIRPGEPSEREFVAAGIRLIRAKFYRHGDTEKGLSPAEYSAADEANDRETMKRFDARRRYGGPDPQTVRDNLLKRYGLNRTA